MFQNDCTLPLLSDLFAQAAHPSEPLLTVGLASGHVECFRLPSQAPSPNSDASDGRGHIASLWKTKRHKGSCRALDYSPDGSFCYSAGTDALVKQFSPETGQVVSKVAIQPSLPTRGVPDQPSILKVLTPQNLLLACDSGAIHLYDLRDARPSAKPAQIHIAHDDFVSSMTTLPPSDASKLGIPRQIVSTGSTTLAVVDVRMGIMAKSEDQEDELLCSVFVPGIGPRKNQANGMLFAGTSSGVLTMWDRGSWDDQQDRMYLNRLESVDAVSLIPGTKKLVAALGNGHMAIVNADKREVEATLSHDDEGAIAVDFDCHGRMISGGGRAVKVWEEVQVPWDQAEGNEDANDDSDVDDDDDDGEDNEDAAKRKTHHGSDSDSSEDERPKKRKKKAKKGKKARQGTGVYGHHGIMGFPDL